LRLAPEPTGLTNESCDNRPISVGHASGVTGRIGQEPLAVTDNPRPAEGGTYKKE